MILSGFRSSPLCIRAPVSFVSASVRKPKTQKGKVKDFIVAKENPIASDE